jgi:hypothetical protein
MRHPFFLKETRSVPFRYTKDQALALAQSSRTALDQIFTALDEELIAQGQLDDGWKVKDLFPHLIFWERFMIGNIIGDPEAVAQRRSLSSDAAVDQINAAVLAEHRDRPLSDLLAEYRASFQRAIETIAALSDAQCAEHHNLIAFNTYDHYLEHAHQLSRWVLTQQP